MAVGLDTFDDVFVNILRCDGQVINLIFIEIELLQLIDVGPIWFTINKVFYLIHVGVPYTFNMKVLANKVPVYTDVLALLLH